MEVILPLTMNEIYPIRDRIYDWVIELQDRYNVLILSSAISKA